MAIYIDGKKIVNSLVIDGDTSGGLTPISWDNETHNVQRNRTIAVDGYDLTSIRVSDTYSVGILSMPVSVPSNIKALLVEYDIIGVSVSSTQYYPTVFCSDTQMTGVTDRTSTYGYKALKQADLASGEAIRGLHEVLDIPSTSFYFNIQFGTTSFENVKLFAITT